ncbi:sulfotransferase [Pseudooceanicola sp.]|uniref:sulfotransferase n=1 Tax=Pseudooceanicola sp. TaxID=1914328 RepID=UPI0035C75E44
MARLIYILGSGRSGSTVLERVLNSSPRVVALGEVHALWRLPVERLRCACGAAVPECGFWQAVLAGAGITRQDLTRLADLERRVVRHRYLIRLGYDLRRIAADPRLTEFLVYQGRIFDSARRVSGAEWVVDSSKAGPRAWVLAARDPPLFLHSHRGAGQVLTSWRRAKFDPGRGGPMRRPSLHRAALDWIKAEQAARQLARQTALRRIDYRAFASDPRETLSAALDCDLPGLVAEVPWRGPDRVAPGPEYHSVLGNPDRFDRREIVIAPRDAADRGQGPWPERLMIRALGRGLDGIYR